MANVIELIVRGTDAASPALEKTKAGLGGLEQGAGGLVAGLKAAASALGLFKVAQTAIQWGREGAAIDATRTAFYELAGGAREAESMLRAIRRESGGTIDAFTAMNAASQLLRLGLADSSEGAARMITAAEKLGRETMTAEERVSGFAMMLANRNTRALDNYGLSIGTVTTRVEELMRTQEGMTRDTAFQIAVMEDAERALAQLGSSTDNMASSWDRLGAATKDNADILKEYVAQALTPAAESLAQTLSFFRRVDDALADNTDAALDSGRGWEEYARGQLRAQMQAQRGFGILAAVNEALRAQGEETLNVGHLMKDWNIVIDAAIRTGVGFGETLSKAEYKTQRLGQAVMQTVPTLSDYYKALQEGGQGVTYLGDETDKTRERFEQYVYALEIGQESISKAYERQSQMAIEARAAAEQHWGVVRQAIGGPLQKEIQSYSEKMADLNAAMAENRSQVAAMVVELATLEDKQGRLTKSESTLAEKLRENIGSMEGAYDGMIAEIDKLTGAHEDATRRIIFGFMEQRLAIDGLTEHEMMALQEVAHSWGLIDDATYTAIQGVDALATAFEKGAIPVSEYGAKLSELKDHTVDFMIAAGDSAAFDVLESRWRTGASTMLEYTEGVANLKRAIDGLEGKDISIGIRWDIPALPQVVANLGGADVAMRAGGGHVPTSEFALVGEEGPELVHLPAGARVHTARETARMHEGGVEIHAPITVHATVSGQMDVYRLADEISEIIGRRVQGYA
jgi:hypothetical protein